MSAHSQLNATISSVRVLQITAERTESLVEGILIQSLGDTVQTGTGKVDPARKFKCTSAAGEHWEIVITGTSL